jgi:two-component system, NarL family, sensor kinase
MMLRRLPIDSNAPLELFAYLRLGLTALGLVLLLALGQPFGGEATLVVGALMVPWSVVAVVVSRRRPEIAIHPAFAVVDFALLAVLEVAAPETYDAVRFAALFLVAVHAHFQGERRGLAITVGAVVLIVGPAVIAGDVPSSGRKLAFYESLFAVAACATALMVGRLRTAESASRLRARGVSRRSMQAESELRRRLSESIHDGPVQELIGLDMVLATAGKAAADGNPERALELIANAREVTGRNIQALRDEIVDLGPYAFEELTFESAIDKCMPTWRRRYGFTVMATLERIDMPSGLAGDLFRIAQEAITNAGRHARAETVSISLRSVDGDVELRIADDGEGFANGGNPLAAAEPGHLGLASMRARAELMGGRLEIETSELGTKVLIRARLPKRRV